MTVYSDRFVTIVMQTSDECILNDHLNILEASLVGDLCLMLPRSM